MAKILNAYTPAGGADQSKIVQSSTIGDRLEVVLSKAAGLDITAPKAIIYRYNPTTGTKDKLFDKARLIDIAEMGGLDHDAVILRKMAVTVGGAYNANSTEVVTEARMIIKLSELGGIDLPTNNDEIRIELENLEVGTAVTINHLEHNIPTDVYENYETISTDAQPNRKIEMEPFVNQGVLLPAVEKIAIERSANLESIEVKFKSGKVVKMLPEEIDAQTRHTMGIVYQDEKTDLNIKTTRLQFNAEKNYVLPVGDVDYIQVNTNGTAVRVILERTMNLPTPSKSVATFGGTKQLIKNKFTA